MLISLWIPSTNFLNLSPYPIVNFDDTTFPTEGIIGVLTIFCISLSIRKSTTTKSSVWRQVV